MSLRFFSLCTGYCLSVLLFFTGCGAPLDDESLGSAPPDHSALTAMSEGGLTEGIEKPKAEEPKAEQPTTALVPTSNIPANQGQTGIKKSLVNGFVNLPLDLWVLMFKKLPYETKYNLVFLVCKGVSTYFQSSEDVRKQVLVWIDLKRINEEMISPEELDKKYEYFKLGFWGSQYLENLFEILRLIQANCSVIALDLRGMGITEEAVVFSLVTKLQRLEIFKLPSFDDSHFPTEEEKEQLTCLTNLTTGNFANSEFFLSVLSQLTSLQALQFEWNTTTQGVIEESTCPHLTHLRISVYPGAQIGSDSLLSFLNRHSSQLKNLELEESLYDKDGVKKFEQNLTELTNLTSLTLDEVRWPPESVLNRLTNLIELKQRSMESIEFNTDVSALSVLINLKKLNLKGNKFENREWFLVQGISKLTLLTDLNLSQTGMETGKVLPYFTCLQNLTKLNIDRGSSSQINKGFQGLPLFTNLTDLSLARIQLTPEVVKALSACSKLCTLNIEGNEIDPLHIGLLVGALKNLKVLKYSLNPSVDLNPKSLEIFNPSLKHEFNKVYPGPRYLPTQPPMNFPQGTYPYVPQNPPQGGYHPIPQVQGPNFYQGGGPPPYPPQNYQPGGYPQYQ